MDKQREEFEKLLGNEFDPEGIYWEWFKKGQTAMQPEIEMWKQYRQNSVIMCNELIEQLSAANQRIQELEKDYAVWREYTGKVNDRNIELEERIRVADAEQKAQWRREVLEEVAVENFGSADSLVQISCGSGYVAVMNHDSRENVAKRRLAEQPESNCACYPDDKDADKRQCNECPR